MRLTDYYPFDVVPYRRHYCQSKHRTHRAVARCLWTTARISGEGPYAAVYYGRDVGDDRNLNSPYYVYLSRTRGEMIDGVLDRAPISGDWDTGMWPGSLIAIVPLDRLVPGYPEDRPLARWRASHGRKRRR